LMIRLFVVVVVLLALAISALCSSRQTRFDQATRPGLALHCLQSKMALGEAAESIMRDVELKNIDPNPRCGFSGRRSVQTAGSFYAVATSTLSSTGENFTSFSSTMVVPPLPSDGNKANQVIYFYGQTQGGRPHFPIPIADFEAFAGLAYGAGPVPGSGPYWIIWASMDGAGIQPTYGKSVRVEPGDTVAFTGQLDKNGIYTVTARSINKPRSVTLASPTQPKVAWWFGYTMAMQPFVKVDPFNCATSLPQPAGATVTEIRLMRNWKPMNDPNWRSGVNLPVPCGLNATTTGLRQTNIIWDTQ